MLRLLLLCGLATHALGMTFTPSPDEAGHMRSNWDNWGMIHNVRHSCLLLGSADGRFPLLTQH